MGPTDLEPERVRAARQAARDITAAALPGGAAALLDAVGACHAAADRLWAAILPSAAAGAACASGCGWCCHQRVEASAVEVLAIARSLRRHPEAPRLRDRLISWNGGRACPFLDGGTCALYPVRPLKCRGLYQPDPRWCMATFAKIDPPEGGPPVRHHPLALPRRIYDAAGQGMTLPLHRAGLDCAALEFVAALRAVVDRPEAASDWARGRFPFPPEVRLHRWIDPGPAAGADQNGATVWP